MLCSKKIEVLPSWLPVAVLPTCWLAAGSGRSATCHYNEDVPLSTLQQPKMTGDDDQKLKVTRNVEVLPVMDINYSKSSLTTITFSITL